MRLKVISLLLFFISAFALNGVLTNDEFEWWFIPIGVISLVYMIVFAIIVYKKMKNNVL